MRVTTLITIISVAVSVARGSTVATAQGEVDFTRDVAPIFTRHCTVSSMGYRGQANTVEVTTRPGSERVSSIGISHKR